LILVRERAGRRGITLESTVDERLGEVRADERKVRQVVLNLLSNAIKFTPEDGRIEVGAVPRGGTEGVEMKCLSCQHESPRRHKLTRSGAHTSLLAHTSAFA
jgi:signal transduction histidine kinase